MVRAGSQHEEVDGMVRMRRLQRYGQDALDRLKLYSLYWVSILVGLIAMETHGIVVSATLVTFIWVCAVIAEILQRRYDK